MSLGDDREHISNAEAVRRGHEADMRRREADYQEQRMLESDEAEASRWSGILGRMRWERPEVHYLDATPDRRVFAVEGDLIEQARRDAERHGFPGGAA